MNLFGKAEKNRFAVIFAVVMILLGAACMLQAFFRAYTEIKDEYANHLSDTAWSVDRNMDLVFRSTRKLLGNMLGFSANAEKRYLEDRDPEGMLEFIENQPVMELEFVYSMMLLQGDDVLLCTACREDCDFAFPDGVNTDVPCLCIGEEGRNYLAIADDSPHTELSYAALIDLKQLYSTIVPGALMNDYWLIFFDKDTGLYIQNGEKQPEVRRYSVEEALERGDGISLLAAAEIEQQSITKAYVFDNTDFLIRVTPTAVNNNGVFSVGVAVPVKHFTVILKHIFRTVAGSLLLVLSGFALLLINLIRDRQLNSELREKVELLELEKNGMQQIAHRQRLELIGTMTSGIAHEFNNLLTPILSYSILSMEQLPPDSTELGDNLAGIYIAAERAKTLVSRISALSRKNTEASCRLFSPDRLLDTVQDMAGASLPPKVEVVMDCHCPEFCLFANETRIGQLLLNIEINALQAMEENGGTLTISTCMEDGNVVFRFRDTGPGISPENLPQLFEPFFTTKEPGRGTGLGLAISRQIAESYNGTITVESQPGIGTLVTVVLPGKKDKG